MHVMHKNIEGKIPDITNLATNNTLNVKINEFKISNVSNLAEKIHKN